MDELCLTDEEVRRMEEAQLKAQIEEDIATMHLPPETFPGLKEAPLG